MASTVARRVVRAVLWLGAGVLAVVVLGGCEVSAPYTTFWVTTTADGSDAVIDGVCEMTPGEGDCSLRAAIDEANAVLGSSPQVMVPGGTYVLTAPGTDDANGGGDLDVTPAVGRLRLVGWDDGVAIDAGGAEGVLHVHQGLVVVERVALTGAAGAGLAVEDGAVADLEVTSIHGNGGPGVAARGGIAAVSDGTVAGNGGPGVQLDAPAVFVGRFATVTDNGGGGVIGPGDAQLRSSIVAEQASGADCSGPVHTSDGWNVDGDGSCGLSQPTDAPSTPPGLGAPTAGVLPARLLPATSPVAGLVPSGTPVVCDGTEHPADQLGVARPHGGACDPGAVEAVNALVVDDPADVPDAAPGDGVCDAGGGTCTLRAAIDEVNAAPAGGSQRITLAVDPVLSLAGGGEDANATGDLDVTGSVTIEGAGHTIDAAGIDRVVDHRNGALVLRDVTLTGGDSRLVVGGTGTGGGIEHVGGSLRVERSTITGNRSEIEGGGVFVAVGDVEVVESVVSDNEAVAGEGGGVATVWSDASVSPWSPDVVVRRSTLEGNEARYGGAVASLSTAHPGYSYLLPALRIEQSTLSGNAAVRAGGVYAGGGVVELAASTLADNQATEGGTATAVWQWYGGSVEAWDTLLDGASPLCVRTGHEVVGFPDSNLAADGTCGGSRGPILLGPLADNGGPTPTHLPAANSAAVDALDAGSVRCRDLATDQRGEPRPQGGGCDVGAVEGTGPAVPEVDVVVDTAVDVVDAVPGDGLCDTGAGACSLRAAVTETNLSPTFDSITIAPGVAPVLSLAGTGEDGNAAGDLDVEGFLTLVGGGATIDGGGLDRVLHVVDGALDASDVTVTGGAAGDGAGVRLEAGSLDLDGVDVTGNAGTGLRVESGTLDLEGADVSGNAGTGLHQQEGASTVTASALSGNARGVHLAGGTMALQGTTVSGNVGGEGAGIYLAGGDLDVEDGTISTNTSTGSGGGLRAIGGSATLRRTSVADNAAVAGGGASWSSSSSLEVTSSSLVGNEATGGASSQGGGIDVSRGTVSLTNVTVAGNQAAVRGGGVASAGNLSLTATTVAGNSAPTATALARVGGSATVRGTILSGAVPVCGSGASTSLGHNLAGDGSCGLSEPSDLPWTNPMLASLADNGGATPSLLPAGNSPAVDAVAPGTTALCAGASPVDQRGVARPQGAGCDIGAVEGSGPALAPLSLVVDTSADGDDVDPGDGTCDDGTGACSLRAAISEANAWPTPDLVTIAPGVDPVLGIAGADEDANATGDLDVTDPLELDGAGSTLDAAGIDRALEHFGALLEVRDLTITGGSTTSGSGGGGVLHHLGSLVVSGSTIIGNETSGVGSPEGGGLALRGGAAEVVDSVVAENAGDGGGIYQLGGALTVRRTTIERNAGSGVYSVGDAVVVDSTLEGNSGVLGGAIQHRDGNLSVVRSTIADNTAEQLGGAVYSTGTVEVEQSTIVGNQATSPVGSVGGIQIRSGVLTLVASTLVGNSEPALDAHVSSVAQVRGSVIAGPGRDCGRDIVSQGFNLDGDGSCGFHHEDDLPSAPPLLLGLADNGGLTETLLPREGSPLVGAVPSGTSGLCDGSLATDQRGGPRPVGGACDVGAVEGSDPVPFEPLVLTVTRGPDAEDADPGDGVCAAVGGGCTLRAAITEANLSEGPDAIAIAAGVTPEIASIPAGQSSPVLPPTVVEHVTVEAAGATIHATSGSALWVEDGGLTLRGATLLDGGLVVDNGLLEVVGSELVGAGVQIAFGNATIEDSDLRGSAGFGARLGAGWLRIAGSRIEDNQGGLSIEGGRAEVVDSTVAGNSSVYDGGGIRLRGGTLVVERSTIVDNEALDASAERGGGIYTESGTELVVTASTVHGNRAEEGGGLYTRGYATVVSSTITGNVAATGSAWLDLATGTSVAGSILDGPGSACSGTIESGGYNVVSDGSCALAGPGDVVARPLLGPLADNGGPTATRLLASNSPGVDAVPVGAPGLCDGSLSTDQRGAPRPDGLACDAGAVEGTGPAILPLAVVVDDPTDAGDAAPGDGVCDAGSGTCTLRAAVDEANVWPTADAIAIAAGVDPVLALTGSGDEDVNAAGDLDVLDDLEIVGAGATVDARGIDRVLHVLGGEVVLRDLVLTGGRASIGGGIRVADGGVEVVDARITGNEAVSAGGGGVQVDGGSLELVGSTVDANTAAGAGGAVALSDGSLVVQRSTIAGNEAGGPGGVSASAASVDVVASTVVGNVSRGTGAGWQLRATGGGTVTILGSVVDGPGPDCAGVTSLGHNVGGDATCALSATGDQAATDPLLGPLVDLGGLAPVHQPFAGSPVLDAVPAGTAGLCDGTQPVDQVGTARPQGPACDAGAVEGSSGVPWAPLSMVVDAAVDGVDALPGDGVCDTGTGTCTLRAAVQEANAWPGADDIAIAPGVDPVLSLAGTGEDLAATGDVDVLGDVALDGGGAVVDAGGLDRALHLRAGELTIDDLEVRGGVVGGVGAFVSGSAVRVDGGDLVATGLDLVGNVASAGGGGGAAYVSAGSAHLSGSHVLDNRGGGLRATGGELTVVGATVEGNSAFMGGGLQADGGVVDVVDSVLRGNEAKLTAGAPVSPGGAAIRLNGGQLTVTGSAIVGNRSLDAGSGGALYVLANDPVDAAIRSTTISGNQATYGAVLAASTGTTTSTVALAGVTVVDNVTTGPIPGDLRGDPELTVTAVGSVLASSGTACHVPLTSGGHNVGSDASCGLGAAGDQASVEVLLGPLADNGGPTPTHLPYANSPVVDAVPAGTVGLCDGTLPTDQRGVARPQGAGCDVGAVEGASAVAHTGPLALVVDTAADGGDAAPGDGLCDDGAGACTLRAAIDEANAWPGADAIAVVAGVDPVLALAGDGEDANATGDLDVIGDVAIDGAGATLDAAGLDRGLHVLVGDVTVADLTVTGGHADVGGGVLAASGSLQLTGGSLAGNAADAEGGGLAQLGGDLVLDGTTVSANGAGASGGGLHLAGRSTRLTEVAVDGNTASAGAVPARGGGVHHVNGSLVIERSTISGNTATSNPGVAQGGGLYTDGTAMVTSSTISGNIAGGGTYLTEGGGIWTGSNLTLTASTVVGGNAARGAALYRGSGSAQVAGSLLEGQGRACFGSITSSGHNVVADATCGFAAAGDVQGVALLLAPLAANGGPTATHLPQPGSPALEAVAVGTTGLCDGALPTDQRGVARPTGPACDVGAVEQ